MADESLPAGSGIYEILNIVNGKRYVGSAVNLALRWRQHRCELGKGRHNPHMQNAWSKHGEAAFRFRVIELVADKADLLAREQHYIDTLRPEYNCAQIAGSNLGTKMSVQARTRVSEANLKRWATPGHREKMSAAHRGKTLPPEQRAKIGESHRGRKLSPQHAATIARHNRERNQSPEHKAKMSAYWRGRPKTAEQIAKMAASKKGKRPSEEHRLKAAEGFRRAIAEGRRTYPSPPPEVRQRIGRAFAKLSDDQVREVRLKRLSGAKCKNLSADYGVSQSAISNICSGKTYAWVED